MSTGPADAAADAARAATAPRIRGWALARRILVISAPPMLLTLWLAVPALHPAPVDVQGLAAPHRACVGRWCGELVAVSGQVLACRVDLIGLPADCRLRGAQARGLPAATLIAGVPVQAQVVRMPSLLSLLRLAPTESVLLRLQQGDQLLFRRSLQGHAWGALYGGWLFHAIYWPLAALVIALWPGSGTSRRLWSRITWTEAPTTRDVATRVRRDGDA